MPWHSQLDTISHYQTPEGVELSLSLAGPMVRGIAWLIDLAIRIFCYFVLAILLACLVGWVADFCLSASFVSDGSIRSSSRFVTT